MTAGRGQAAYKPSNGPAIGDLMNLFNFSAPAPRR
jgi:hypothetical protein